MAPRYHLSVVFPDPLPLPQRLAYLLSLDCLVNRLFGLRPEVRRLPFEGRVPPTHGRSIDDGQDSQRSSRRVSEDLSCGHPDHLNPIRPERLIPSEVSFPPVMMTPTIYFDRSACRRTVKVDDETVDLDLLHQMVLRAQPAEGVDKEALCLRWVGSAVLRLRLLAGGVVWSDLGPAVMSDLL